MKLKRRMSLKEIRNDLELTQVEAAIKCNVAVGTYRLWESEAGRPNEDNRPKVCEIFGVDKSFFDKR